MLVVTAILIGLIWLPWASSLTSVFTKGVSMMQLVVEKPGKQMCVSEDLKLEEHVSAFVYAVSPANYDVPMELTLYDDMPNVLMSKGPEKKVVELDSKPSRAGVVALTRGHGSED